MPNINKNIIMQAGASVANATNKAAGLSASTPEPGSIISAIQLVNGGRTIGPDALAHFTESVRNKLLSLLVSMEPVQDFNGYGHPWPAGGGVNLFDPDNLDTVTVAGSNRWGHQYTTPGTYAIKAYGVGESAYLYAKVLNTDNTWSSNYYIAGNTTPYAQIITITSGQSLYVFDASNHTVAQASDLFSAWKIQVAFSSTQPDQYYPYENDCRITGRTGLSVYVGPTSAVGDAATYSMDWTSPAGTVYAGSADIVTGDIKAAPYYASYNGETLVGPWVSSLDVYDPEGTPTTGAQVVDLSGAMTNYHITGQDIITLVGDNYIWSDSGDVTIIE